MSARTRPFSCHAHATGFHGELQPASGDPVRFEGDAATAAVDLLDGMFHFEDVCRFSFGSPAESG